MTAEPVTPRTVFRWAVAASLGVVVVYLGYRAVYTIRDVLVQVIIALFIAVSLDPVVRWMVSRRITRGNAVLIIVVAALVIVGGLLMLLIPPLVHQAGGLTTDFPGYLDKLREQSSSLRSLESRFHLQGRIDDLARTLPGRLGQQVLGLGQRFLGALVSALLVIVLTIYFMLDLPRLRRGFVRLFTKPHRRTVNDAVNVVVDKVGAYMIGNLIISLIAIPVAAAVKVIATPLVRARDTESAETTLNGDAGK